MATAQTDATHHEELSMTDDERRKRILAHYARAPRVNASWFKAYLEQLAHKS